MLDKVEKHMLFSVHGDILHADKKRLGQNADVYVKMCITSCSGIELVVMRLVHHALVIIIRSYCQIQVLQFMYIQIPPTLVFLWLLQVAVPLRVLWGYSDTTETEGWEATAHALATEYPHSTINMVLRLVVATAILCNEAHVAGQEEFGCVHANSKCSLFLPHR